MIITSAADSTARVWDLRRVAHGPEGAVSVFGKHGNARVVYGASLLGDGWGSGVVTWASDGGIRLWHRGTDRAQTPTLLHGDSNYILHGFDLSQSGYAAAAGGPSVPSNKNCGAGEEQDTQPEAYWKLFQALSLLPPGPAAEGTPAAL